MRDAQPVALFRNPRCPAWENAQVPVTLLFSFLLLDLSVYTAIYLLSEFYDPWASETSFKPGHINPKHTDVNEKSSTSSLASGWNWRASLRRPHLCIRSVARKSKKRKNRQRQRKRSLLQQIVLTCRSSAPPRTGSGAAVERASGGQKSS